MNTFRFLWSPALACALTFAAAGFTSALAGPASRWDDDSASARDDSAWLGVRVQEITPELREALKLRDERGALVSDVMKGSPAARAGIKKSDVIVGLDGRAIDSPTDLTDAVSAQRSGEEVRLTIVREGDEITKEARLEDRPVQRERRRLLPPIPPARVEGMAGGGHLGVGTQAMDDDLAAYFGTTGGRGVLVTDVQENSPASAAGIRAGDVILRVEGDAIADPADLLAAVRKKDSGDTIRLEILRQRRETELVATLDDAAPFGGGHARWFDSLRGSMHDFRGRLHEERIEKGQDMKREMAKLREELDELRRELSELKGKLR